MNIAHIIQSIDTSTGGPARSVTHLIRGLLQTSDIEVSLHCKTSSNPIIKDFYSERAITQFYKPTLFGGLSGFKKQIKLKKPNLLHGHGLWQMPVHQMVNLAKRHDLPYIITPRGMLEPWALEQGKWKKKAAMMLFQRTDLQKANVLHATSEMEKNQMRKLGFSNPIAIIPNGIEPNHFNLSLGSGRDRKNVALFLSRIHPKKGIEILIEAWWQLDKVLKKDWILEIVGNGELSYTKELEQKIVKKGIESEVKLLGPFYGDQKVEKYANSDIFILPTYSENFGIVVAESLASGTPVITTKGAPWKDLETHKAGWWIDIGVEPLKQALEEALNMPAAKREEMGRRGHHLVKQKYSIEAVAQKMIRLYEWILEKTNKPDFVYP